MAVQELSQVGVEDIPDLETDELIYLLQRSRHTAAVEAELQKRDELEKVRVNHDPVAQLQNTPNFGDANTKNAPVETAARTREQGEEDESYLEAFETDPRNLTKPQLVGADDDEDDDFEIPDDNDYDSWKNDALRAELQRRAEEGGYQADLDGKKSELAQRLRDQDEAANA